MENYLILRNYEQFSDDNEFTLIRGKEILADKYPERKKEIFQMLLNNSHTFSLIIVQNEEASPWNVQEELEEYHIRKTAEFPIEIEQLCQYLYDITGQQYIPPSGVVENVAFNKKIQVLFSGCCTDLPEEKIPQTETKPVSNVTALAQVIMKKYKKI